jgi:hypothetical protein
MLRLGSKLLIYGLLKLPVACRVLTKSSCRSPITLTYCGRNPRRNTATTAMAATMILFFVRALHFEVSSRWGQRPAGREAA